MRKNVISEIHNMKKKMGLVNEMNFDDIDNESVESRIKKEIKSAVKKELKGSSLFRGLKYQGKYGQPNITILWTSRTWADKSEVTDKVRKIIRDMGYSHNLNISSH